jgi:hypothetical protein
LLFTAQPLLARKGSKAPFARAQDSRVINTLVLEKFDAVWTKQDPHATGWITPEQLYLLLTDLGEPLGVKRADQSAFRPSPSAVLPLATKMDIPIFSRGVPYDMVLHSLVTIAFLDSKNSKKHGSILNHQWCEVRGSRRQAAIC